MPVPSDFSNPIELVDPDLVPRPVVTFSAGGSVRVGVSRHETAFHCHSRGELLALHRGVLTCEMEGGLWHGVFGPAGCGRPRL
jgi:hypothetical protein